MDFDEMTTKVIAYLTTYATTKAKGAADAIMDAAGKRLLGWLKTKLGDAEGKGDVDAVMENPESKGTQRRLEGAVLTKLEKAPALARELEALLAELSSSLGSVHQTQTVTGDNNSVIQISGSGNKVGS